MPVEERLGRVIIAPEVLTTVIKLTALSTPGVVRMSGGLSGSMGRLLRRGVDQGMRIGVEGGVVSVDLYIIVEPEVNMLHLGQTIQSEVTRAISEIVGMPVQEVNVHIVDVEGPATRQ